MGGNHQMFILGTSFVAHREFCLWSDTNTSLLPEHNLIYAGNVQRINLSSNHEHCVHSANDLSLVPRPKACVCQEKNPERRFVQLILPVETRLIQVAILCVCELCDSLRPMQSCYANLLHARHVCHSASRNRERLRDHHSPMYHGSLGHWSAPGK